ncbi:asparagine synthase (glutamine-hydrolyzing) [Carnobacterium sp. CS13]|uniref:asparagine synthase (glutamine-hydrolyzing) n=1 Tax=Carnobacterium sp. CS13 TaxID=2800128 RepID=UPI001911B8A9|nr:asparagine synthase (glutamine-hydrolyzing) [Carnobacterium sp. CS13]QQP70490.1 asparagine synthase (glutamine-hydrolyzing) [Carnobacterium sp. CS13]
MCGFVGCLSNDGETWLEEQKAVVEKMNKQIIHRGPDDEGYYFDDAIALGFRRLSIIDIENGHQPLSYEGDRYRVIFNGEIYNYIELRNELIEKGFAFQTDSDTEVILAAYLFYKEEVTSKLRGMFAFVIWDKHEKTLFGARDQFGIKPFYYAVENNCLYIASEKKSILSVLDPQPLNQASLQNYLTFQYVPGPETMHTAIKALAPGHFITKKMNEDLTISKYWQADFTPAANSEEHITAEIRAALFDSIEKHMRSDVPVGAFLSGGIDSSIVVAIAREFNPKLKTLSVGFEREGYSEINLAEETAEELKVENFSYTITAQEFMDEFPRFVWHMDDPLADPAAVPQFFLSRLARKHVKVALSGEGADELFGGYGIYNEPNSLKLFKNTGKMTNRALNRLARLMPEGVKGKSFLIRGTMALEDRYVGNAKIFDEFEKKKILVNYDLHFPYQAVTKPFYEQTINYDPIDRMQLIDINTWLSGDLLLNADRTTMAYSLELRTPFLDKEVFEVARKIPAKLRIANGTTKYILRKAVEGIVPDNVIYRKKLGFPVPIRHWLKDELYEWALAIIKESKTEHLLEKPYLINLLEKHRTGKIDHSRKIWTALTFMVWHRIYVEEPQMFLTEPKPLRDKIKQPFPN